MSSNMSEDMLNQSLFEDDHHHRQVMLSGKQMGLFGFPHTNNLPLFNYGCCGVEEDAPAYNPTDISLSSLTTASTSKQHHQLAAANSSHLGSLLPQLPTTFQRSTTTTANLWAWGEVKDECMSNIVKMRSTSSGAGDNQYIGVSAMKMKKKIKAAAGRRKVREPRFSFKTMSNVDVLDDGYKWRKYGQKVVKDTHHPRSYYRCTQDNCRVKKRVERLAEDPRMVITTYEGRHMHSPSHDNHDQEYTSEF